MPSVWVISHVSAAGIEERRDLVLGGRVELEGTTVLAVRKDVTERPHAKSLQGGCY